jgi:predicted acylesterase/phospholipase RssA
MRTLVATALLTCIAASTAGSAQPARPAAPTAVRELRLGVVCYGGLSLAVYMFGTTRELHNLLRASRALELDAGELPQTRGEGFLGEHGRRLAKDSPSAVPYYELLRKKWSRDGVRTRVVIDIISGTSAGGINGVILAKAIATGAPIDGLRELWFDHADIRRLAGHRWWLAWAVGRVLVKKPALLGDNWLRQIYGAFQKMDSQAGDNLLPPDPHAPLRLLVTSTDLFGSRRVVEIGDPATSPDIYHNHVFRFVHPADEGLGFSGNMANAALAFAARSSASFPVVFPPTTIDRMLAALPADPEHPLDAKRLARELYGHQLADRGRCTSGTGEELPEACQEELARELYLVDGGALDNKPLGIAFRLAGRTTPSVPAQRVFLYLQPDPEPLPKPGPNSHGDGPNSWQTGLAVLFKVRGAEPIGGDFLELAQHNARVDRLLDVIARNEQLARRDRSRTKADMTLRPSVAAEVESVVPFQLDDPNPPGFGAAPGGPAGKGQSPPDDTMLKAVTEQRVALENAAAAAQPIANEAYLRLRVHSVLAQLAHDLAGRVCGLPDDYDGPRATLAREIVIQWAEGERIKAKLDRGGEPFDETRQPIDADRRAEFLAAWDLGYLRRNLRFALDWIDNQYPGSEAFEAARAASQKSPQKRDAIDSEYGMYELSESQIEAAHDAVTAQIRSLTATLRGDLASIFPDPDKAAKEATSRQLQAELAGLSAALCAPPRDISPADELTKDEAARLLDLHRDKINAFVDHLTPRLIAYQDRIRAELFTAFMNQTAGWSQPTARRAVLARYLGFPFWDRVTYPYTAFSGTGELSHANVVRLSPDDATELSRGGAQRLTGAKTGHFGAFLSNAAGRQKDYIWGRLDGAERLARLLDREVPIDGLLGAIVAEEEDTKAIDPGVVRQLKDCLANPRQPICDEAAPN